MFESLQERLGSILNGLTGRGTLSEADVSAALREVRRALLEADVALEVVRSFTDKVREKAVGAAVLKSIKPGHVISKSFLRLPSHSRPTRITSTRITATIFRSISWNANAKAAPSCSSLSPFQRRNENTAADANHLGLFDLNIAPNKIY